MKIPLGRFHETGSFFVIRAKTNLKASVSHHRRPAHVRAVGALSARSSTNSPARTRHWSTGWWHPATPQPPATTIPPTPSRAASRAAADVLDARPLNAGEVDGLSLCGNMRDAAEIERTLETFAQSANGDLIVMVLTRQTETLSRTLHRSRTSRLVASTPSRRSRSAWFNFSRICACSGSGSLSRSSTLIASTMAFSAA